MANGPVTQRRFSRRVVRQAMLAGTAVVVLAALAAGGWYLYSARAGSAAAAAKKQSGEQAQQLASAIVRPIADISAQLQALAKDAALIALFEQQDKAALENMAAQRVGEIPSALRLRLLLPGGYELEHETSPPLSFASLDLLKRAEESSGPVSVEVHLFGSPGQHIVLIQAVRNQAGQLVGLAHLSLDVNVVQAALEKLELGSGSLELRQTAGSRTVVLGSAGPAHGEEKPVIVSVPDTRWNVAYWSGAGTGAGALTAGEGSSRMLVLAVALLAVIAAGAAWFIRRRSGNSGDPEMAPGITYAGAVKAIMEGAHPGMEQLIPNLPKLGQKGPIKPVSRGMAGEDITMMVKRDQMGAGSGSPAAAKPAPPRATPAVKDQPAKAKPPAPPTARKAPQAVSDTVQLTPGIFRAYDIRGVVGKTLSAGVMEVIGQAIGSEAAARGVSVLALGRDGRKSSPELAQALGKGLCNAGRNVIDIGMVPTPLLYFATHHLDVGGGVMVTGSHNRPEYNGVKVVLAGESLSGDAIRDLFQRVMDDRLEGGSGEIHSAEIIADYIRRVCEDIPVALGGAYKLVVDCGNGVAGGIAPKLLQALGHDVVELFCEVDGSFPNHQPDPSQPENLETLRAWVAESGADLGLAFDGDGDRLGVVDSDGNIIWPDRQLMLLARDVLSRNPGTPIIFDVKCSRHLRKVIEDAGGKPYMWRTGHSLIKGKMKELDAPLAGEMSGHIFFKERWYGFDDAIYTAARLLEVLMKSKKKPVEVFKELPQGVSTPELRVEMPEEDHAAFMGNLSQLLSFDGAEVSDVDGFRVEFADGWGLVRPSNTSPMLVLRFEADSEAALQRIQGQFRDALRTVKPDLKLPF